MKKFGYAVLELENKLEAVENILKCYEEKLKEFMTEEEFKSFKQETARKLIRNELEGIKDEKIKSLAEELFEELLK